MLQLMQEGKEMNQIESKMKSLVLFVINMYIPSECEVLQCISFIWFHDPEYQPQLVVILVKCES